MHEYKLPICGVYIIRCVPVRSVYVGSAVFLRRRFCQHALRLRKGEDFRAIQDAWNQYGEESLRFRVIEKCDYRILSRDLRQREQYWVDFYVDALGRDLVMNASIEVEKCPTRRISE